MGLIIRPHATQGKLEQQLYWFAPRTASQARQPWALLRNPSGILLSTRGDFLRRGFCLARARGEGYALVIAPDALALKRILIVEGDTAFGLACMSALIVAHFDAEHARSEARAIELLGPSPADAIFVNLALAGGGAFRLLKRIRANPKLEAAKVVGYLRDQSNEQAILDAKIAGVDEVVVFGKNAPQELLALAQKLRAPTVAETVVAAPPPPTPRAPTTSIPFPEDEPATDESAPIPNAPVAEAPNLRRTIAVCRELVQSLWNPNDAPKSSEHIAAMARAFEEFGSFEAVLRHRPLKQVGEVLLALLEELSATPHSLSQSNVRTLNQAVSFIETAAKETARNGSENPPTAKVLLVDDDAVARGMMKRAMALLPVEADTVDDPAQALAAADKTRYELFVLDVNMPVMTGYELCERLRKLPPYKRTPVIFVTAWHTFESRMLFARSGGDDFIAKPFLPSELATKALLHLLRP